MATSPSTIPHSTMERGADAAPSETSWLIEIDDMLRSPLRPTPSWPCVSSSYQQSDRGSALFEVDSEVRPDDSGTSAPDGNSDGVCGGEAMSVSSGMIFDPHRLRA